MNVLDSRLPELAFNYVGFGVLTVVNNLWTWIAILTAAISFWRIKAGSRTSSCSAKPKRSTVGFEPNPEASIAEVSPRRSTVHAATVGPSVCNVEMTKGKFIMYYEDELTAVREGEENGEWWEVWPWERVLRSRKGGSEWYEFQDLTLLSGNVVRVWDRNVRERAYQCQARTLFGR